MRRFPAAGSRTAASCNKGLSNGRTERKRGRLARLAETLPPIKFDAEGNGSFTVRTEEDHEAIRTQAQRQGWMWTHESGSKMYAIVCVSKAKAYLAGQKRQYNADCVDAIGQLEFLDSDTAMYSHNGKRDLVHGLELLAKQHGWIVSHQGKVAKVTKPARRAA